jgi:sugar lactone lactonase YvrE
VDARNRRLYVADPGGKRIWLLDLAAQEPSPRIYSRALELQSPVGITVAPDGIVWVADPRANRLFAIGPEGQVLKKLP